MISCSYNGWTDLPEDEREALDALEAPRMLPTRVSVIPSFVRPQRKAA